MAGHSRQLGPAEGCLTPHERGAGQSTRQTGWDAAVSEGAAAYCMVGQATSGTAGRVLEGQRRCDSRSRSCSLLLGSAGHVGTSRQSIRETVQVRLRRYGCNPGACSLLLNRAHYMSRAGFVRTMAGEGAAGS